MLDGSVGRGKRILFYNAADAAEAGFINGLAAMF